MRHGPLVDDGTRPQQALHTPAAAEYARMSGRADGGAMIV